MKIMLWQRHLDRDGEKLVATFYDWATFCTYRDAVCAHNTRARSFSGLSEYTVDDFRRDYRWVITSN